MSVAVRVGVVLAALTVFSFPARAQNLVQNPGFEDSTGPTSSPGWMLGSGGGTVFDSGSEGTDVAPQEQPPQGSGGNPNAHMGLWDVQFGATSADQATTSSLSQTIATVPGQIYLISFFLMNTDGPHNTFLATFGGQTVTSMTDSNAFGYTQISGQVKATSTSSLLAFTAEQDPGFFYLDDVSVEPAPAPAVGGGLLSAAAMLAVLGIRRARRRIAA